MGADYEKAKIQALIWSSGGNVIAAGATEYLAVSHMEAIENRVMVPVPFACILRNMRVHLDIAPGGADTITVTFRQNVAPGNQAVQIVGAAIWAEDLVNIDALARGDDICIEIVSSATAVNTRPKVCFDLIRI